MKLLDNLKTMKFDPESRFLALYGFDRVRIINLMMQDSIPRVVLDDFSLNYNKYSRILDLGIRSKLNGWTEEYEYECEIACKHTKHQRIQILNINEQDKSMKDD